MSATQLIPHDSLSPGVYIAQKILSFEKKNTEEFQLPEAEKILVQVFERHTGELRVATFASSLSRPVKLFNFYKKLDIEKLLE